MSSLSQIYTMKFDGKHERVYKSPECFSPIPSHLYWEMGQHCKISTRLSILALKVYNSWFSLDHRGHFKTVETQE